MTLVPGVQHHDVKVLCSANKHSISFCWRRARLLCWLVLRVLIPRPPFRKCLVLGL